MAHWLTRHPKAYAATTLAALCVAMGTWLLQPSSGPGAILARASFDSYYTLFNLAEGPPVNSPVVLVYLDLESYLTQNRDPTRPWPRELYAELLRLLTAAGAKAVVFDVVFDSPGSDPVANQLLHDAIAANGRVVLAAELSVSTQSAGEGIWSRTTKLARPIDPFRRAAAAWGLGEISVDEDFVARRHFSGREADGELRLGLALTAARMLELNSALTYSPLSSTRWLRYYGPPFALPHRSLSQVLQERTPDPTFFRDRVVFVGARPMASLFNERRDEFRSPFRSWHERDLFMPGVEVHATQMLNLMRGDWLARPNSTTEHFYVLVAGLLLGLGCILLRPVSAATMALMVSGTIMAAAVLLFRQSGLWFPWLVLVVQIPLALTGSVLFHSLEWYRARRRLEAGQRIAAARIREQAALIDKARDAILVRNLEGAITYANPSAERLYGWTLNELREEPIYAPFGGSRAEEAHRVTLERGEWNGELRQQTRSGKALTVESRWTLLRDDAGQASGLLVINSDITEKKQLETESLRMQRMEAVGALAGGMAHDLNNALAPILMGTQLLRRDARDDQARRILSLMESSTRRGADMVRQVLLFSRGRQGDFECLNLGPLVRELEKLARDTFPQNISVSLQLAEDLWPVRGNATQLHQVLLNLCVNARDSMAEGGSLSLAADNVELSEVEALALPCGRPGAFVVLIVSDTGAGILPQHLPQIFEPFFTTKPEGLGTGLGLSTTARIVNSHEGFIHVESQSGEGTTFEVYFPRFINAPAQSTHVPAAPPPRGHGQLILLADDDEAVRELLRRGLEESGFQVIATANGAEALSIFKQRSHEIALFLSDHSMPVMSGPKAAEIILALRPNLPVLFLSGEAEALILDVGGQQTKVRCCPKPIELDFLLWAISRLLNPESLTGEAPLDLGSL